MTMPPMSWHYAPVNVQITAHLLHSKLRSFNDTWTGGTGRKFSRKNLSSTFSHLLTLRLFRLPPPLGYDHTKCEFERRNPSNTLKQTKVAILECDFFLFLASSETSDQLILVNVV